MMPDARFTGLRIAMDFLVSQQGFPWRLIGLRESQRMTSAELARRVGVSRTAMHKWERGYALPRPDTLCRLAEGLYVTSRYLLIGDDAPRGQLEDAADVLIDARLRLSRATGAPVERIHIAFHVRDDRDEWCPTGM